MWFCYILRNKNNKYKNLTYNGSTNDPIRRLRQHNEEISGGARYTHGKGHAWTIYALLYGFDTHKEALSCEWRIKHPTGHPRKRPGKYCGTKGRIKGLNEVLVLDHWSKQCKKDNRKGEFHLLIEKDYANLINKNNLPDNVTITKLDEISKNEIDKAVKQYNLKYFVASSIIFTPMEI
jgi:predicted GIY-YIG superfamily endonuclease